MSEKPPIIRCKSGTSAESACKVFELPERTMPSAETRGVEEVPNVRSLE